MSIGHVDGWLYRAQTTLGNFQNNSFAGLKARASVTLLSRVKLKSVSYAFPRYGYIADRRRITRPNWAGCCGSGVFIYSVTSYCCERYSHLLPSVL